MPSFGKPRQHIGAAGLIGDQDLARIADRFRRHMLVGRRVLGHGRRMQARPCARRPTGRHRAAWRLGARLRISSSRREVARDPRQRLRRDAGLELAGIGLLQEQGRDQRTQIGIAAALAQPVERALRLARAGADRRQGDGDGLLGVVVGVDAEIGVRQLRLHLGDDAIDLFRHGAAIGVAQHQPGARPHPARA